MWLYVPGGRTVKHRRPLLKSARQRKPMILFAQERRGGKRKAADNCKKRPRRNTDAVEQQQQQWGLSSNTRSCQQESFFPPSRDIADHKKEEGKKYHARGKERERERTSDRCSDLTNRHEITCADCPEATREEKRDGVLFFVLLEGMVCVRACVMHACDAELIMEGGGKRPPPPPFVCVHARGDKAT